MAHPPPHAAQHEGDARDNNSGNGSSTADARGGRVSRGGSGGDTGEEPLVVRKPLAPRVHSVRSEYPLNVAVDFTQLRVRTTRRFACV